jgi:hypothetical protein
MPPRDGSHVVRYNPHNGRHAPRTFRRQAIVPDETVTLPGNTPLTVHVETPATADAKHANRQRAAYEAFPARAKARPGPRLPAAATRREAIYED